MTQQQLDDLRAAAEDEARYPVTAGRAAAAEVLAAEMDDAMRALGEDRTRIAWRPLVEPVLVSALVAAVGTAVVSLFRPDAWYEDAGKLFAAATAAQWLGTALLRRRTPLRRLHLLR